MVRSPLAGTDSKLNKQILRIKSSTNGSYSTSRNHRLLHLMQMMMLLWRNRFGEIISFSRARFGFAV